MLTKILVTILVIAGAMFYIRQSKVSPAKERTQDMGRGIIIRFALYAIVSLSLLASAGYWYWDWQDGNKVVSVTIVSPMSDDSVVYQVRKKNITNNEITTVDGIRVRLSNQERIIVANTVQE
ncbi:hypothetical protein TUM4261_39060 [Shewanella sp. c952]|uniref:hypothetical protein n=1 Tax=Shewanella sp. c952 TaxID=2815913 RepID=UPI001BC41B9B|nr:hypothetical protein [Shewanella sp. c952]GIU18355.1 hypothetical protein TUM4261_39060 [Shewanella sp. c952]